MNFLNSTFESNRLLYSFIVIIVWTVTSFICHYCGKLFLSEVAVISLTETPYSNNAWLERGCHALFLTILQLGLCYLLIDLSNGADSPTQSRVAKIAHALATLATNLSMAAMFASSTFAIKLMEPITSAVVQYLLIGIPVTFVTFLSLPVIVGGAIAFAGNPFEYSNTSLGTLAALTSNLVLAFRNTAIKQMSENGSTPMKLELNCSRLGTYLTLGALTCSSVLFFEIKNILPAHSAYTLAVVCTSALFHVAYSYVSTGLVLNKISVVSHAVANILKRVLVVLLLYAFGGRVASISNFLGLAVCTVGLFVYVWSKTRPRDADPIKDSLEKKVSVPPIFGLKVFSWTTAFLCLVFLTVVNVSNRDLLNSKIREPYPQSSFPALGQLLFTSETNGTNGSKHFSRNTFSAHGHERPTDEELLPVLSNFPDNVRAHIESFLQRGLETQPKDMNFVSERLTQTSEVIREAQRLHFNIFEDALKKYKYAMIFDIASFENKGDPCITVGEFYFLQRIKMKILFYCNFYGCTDGNIKRARKLARNYTSDELIILGHGGGNIIGYPANDHLRFKIFDLFSGFQIFVFPQSIWMRDRKQPHVQTTIDHYCCNPNVTFVLRDRLSYSIAQNLYQGSSRLLMAPDMAFQIGRVERFMSPVFDILWIKREDAETPGYKQIEYNVPNHLRVHISDWWKWLTPAAGSSLEKAFYIATNGFFYIQRGRVVITDRLHGHILATLMDIPHVLIDNKAKKLSAYHNTWTKSIENIVLTDDPSKALELAIGLLQKYNDTLPTVSEYFNIDGDFKPVVHGKADRSYP